MGSISNSRSIPNPPNLVRTPESSIEPWVDASEWASGSQKCVGNRGMFTMNARNSSTKIISWMDAGRAAAVCVMVVMFSECPGV
jgi:hypothetical protein